MKDIIFRKAWVDAGLIKQETLDWWDEWADRAYDEDIKKMEDTLSIKQFAQLIREKYPTHDEAVGFLNRAYEGQMDSIRFAELYYEVKLMYTPRGLKNKFKWRRMAKLQRKKLEEL